MNVQLMLADSARIKKDKKEGEKGVAKGEPERMSNDELKAFFKNRNKH